MVLRLLFVLVFLLFGHYSPAQLIYSLDDDAAYIAGVEKQLASATNDSVRGHLYLRLSVFYKLVSDTAKAREARNKGLTISDNYPFLHAISYFYKAHALYAKMDLVGIENYLMKGDSLLSMMNSPAAFETRGYIWHAFGTIQQIKGDEKTAMSAFINKALPYAKRSGSLFLTGNVKKALAMVLMNANQREKAENYLKDALQDLKQVPQNSNPTLLETLAETHITAAENYAFLNRTSEAKTQLSEALNIISVQPRSNLFLNYYFAEGTYFDKIENYKKGFESASKGIGLAEQVSSVSWANRLRYIAFKNLLHARRYDEAAAELEKLVNDKSVLATDKKIYYKELYTTYALTGEKDKAFDRAEKYIHLSDSLYETEFQSGVVELEKKYNDAEDAKKIFALQSEQQQTELKTRNHRLLIWLLCAALLLVISILALVYFLYKNNRKLSKQKELGHQRQLLEIKQRQKLEQAQALIQGGEQERARLSRDLHDGLGGMLAGVKMNLSVLGSRSGSGELDKVITQLDNSVNELRRIARNMMPETLINSGLETALSDLCDSLPEQKPQISFQAINLQKNIRPDIQVIIYRIAQELITNVLRHAGASRTLVQCSQNGNRFYLTVEDDGRGFNPDAKREGIGLLNIRNRVDYLNGQVEIISQHSRGTTINIEFDVS